MKENTRVAIIVTTLVVTLLYVIGGVAFVTAQHIVWQYVEPTVYVHWAEPTLVRVFSTHGRAKNLALFLHLASWIDDMTPHPNFIKDLGRNITFDSCEAAREAVDVMKNEYHWTVIGPRKGYIHLDGLSSNDWRKDLVGPRYRIEDDTYRYTHECDDCMSLVLECDPSCREIEVHHPCDKIPEGAIDPHRLLIQE